MDVFGLRLSVLMFIENTLARITNEHAIIWSIWKMRSVELEALFRVRVRAAKTALSDLYLLALKLIRNILAIIINALVHENLWACSNSIFCLEWQGLGSQWITQMEGCGQGVLPINLTPPPPPIYPHMQHYIYFVRLLRTVIVWVLCGDLKAFLRRT